MLFTEPPENFMSELKTFINTENGETLLCENTNIEEIRNGVKFIRVLKKHNLESVYVERDKLNYIPHNVAKKLVPSNYGNRFPDQVNCIINYELVNTDWTIKKWFRYDQKKLVQWYNDFIVKYSDWKWTYGIHKNQWQYDPQETIGNFIKEDTSWIMLTWGDDRKGPVPWLRYIAKPEYGSDMPKNLDEDEFGQTDKNLGARECFDGYAREIVDNMPCGPHDIQVSIHTPGTKLPPHQDLPDCFRFHLPIVTNSDAIFTIEGKDIHIPADGWAYLVNTTKLHSTDNKGDQDRVHIYGAVWSHQVLELDLENLETVI